MALLSADDVLNKAFSKTKYREGFDQDEVDDYLDAIAHTIQSLTAERDDLAARLNAALSELQQVRSGSAPVAPVPVAAAGAATTASSADIMSMARQLHQEYITSGQEEKLRILERAELEAKDIVTRAQRDAEYAAQEALERAKRDQAEIERAIEDLRRFERDYRARLTTYLQNLLGDLDHATSQGTPPTANYSV